VALDDTAASAVATMRRLEILRLAGTGLGDAGLAAIATLPRLDELSIAGTRLTDAGCARVGAMLPASVLDLSATQVTAACFAALGPSITTLLADGLALPTLRFARTTRLVTLSLAGTTVDDRGAAALLAMRSLRELRGATLTASARRRLTSAGITLR